MDEYKLTLSVVLALLLSLSSYTPGGGAEYKRELSVTFEEKLTLIPGEEDDLITSETSLTLGKSIGGLDFETETDFGEEDGSFGLFRQKVNLAYQEAQFSADFSAVFDSQINGLNYFLQRTEIDDENLQLSNSLLLEYLNEENTYGAGFETRIEGTTGKGVTVSAAIRFGMDEYLKEVYDPTVEGSGYYIITEGVAGPSQFPSGSALIEISDVGLGPCTVGNRTKFMRGKGLLFSGFSFDLIDKEPWKTRSYVYFSDEDETITLIPTLQFGKDVWNVVADFGGKLEGDNTTLGNLVIRGIKFGGVSIGNVEISGTSALGGKMKKEKGTDQLELHARDYKLVRSFDEIARDYLFKEVDWSDVLTLEYDQLNKGNLERYLALDWYLKRGQAGGLFDVDTVNAIAEWELNPTFSFSTGVSLKAETGLERVVFKLVHDF
ncbi:hypothetical protein K9M78_03985 [Candidatus Bipolaricaulota bacterium]|nr:hypothetical protein [Candidatus Bipolaricaulota bacterium]